MVFTFLHFFMFIFVVLSDIMSKTISRSVSKTEIFFQVWNPCPYVRDKCSNFG